MEPFTGVMFLEMATAMYANELEWGLPIFVSYPKAAPGHA